MELEGEGSFQMRDFSNDICCIYLILASWVLSIINHTMITIERAHYLYALLTKDPIDYGSVLTSTMMFVRFLDKGFTLPYEVLITWIAVRFKVDMAGLREVQLEKGVMGVRFLNASQAHLQEAEQEPRAQWPQRVARVGGTPARLEERMDYFEASLWEMQETLQALQRARAEDHAVLDRLCKHLMGPLDIRDYGIHSSSFSRGRGHTGVRGSPSARRSPGMRGSQSARGTPVWAFVKPTPRRQPLSQFSVDRTRHLIFFSVKSTTAVAILGRILLQLKSTIFRVAILSYVYLWLLMFDGW
jgi:hypothetical protein